MKKKETTTLRLLKEKITVLRTSKEKVIGGGDTTRPGGLDTTRPGRADTTDTLTTLG